MKAWTRLGTASVVLLGMGLGTARAEPGGCLKYGAAGALGGHMVHHGVAGALGGCAVGAYRRHAYRKQMEQQQYQPQQQYQQQYQPQRPGPGYSQQ